MKKMIIASMMGAAAMSSCQQNNTTNYDHEVDELYAKMSMEERVAQLRSCYMDEFFDENGKLDTKKCAEIMPNGIGHFSQFAMQKPMDPNVLRDRVAQMQDWLMHNTPNGIPALFHEEVLSGINTKDACFYPQQIGQACSFNTELAELKTLQTSTQLRKMGGILALSPMVDVCRNPSFNRLEESYGEDGYLSAAMGVAFVKGLQQGDLKKGVGACSKHYLGYGGGGDTDEKEMMEEILLPHEAMICTAGSKVLMPGYHAVHGVKCVANDEILNDILRGYLGFDGMVVSDYTAIDQLPDYPGTTERAAAAINGGNDVDFPLGANYDHLPEALSKGLAKEEAFERAVKAVLRHKFRAGLFDKDPYLYSKETIKLDTDEERQTAYTIATQSVVLLENNGILPLTTKTPKVLLTGPNANTMWAMCGDYTYPAMSYFWKKTDIGSENPHVVSLKEGMEKHAPQGFNLMYSRGCDWTEDIETKYQELGDERAWEYEILHRKVDSGEKADAAEALAMANDCDVIIAAVGENVMLCGENRDRQGLRLPGKQEQYVEQLLATGKPVVLVVFGGRAQVISGIAERCAAVIQAWYPGEEGGNAVADILYGKVSPSAKLSVSYPKEEMNENICYNYSAKQDARIAWPFGYGLSYTTFEYSNLRVTNEAKTTADGIEVSFDIKNTGTCAADEIAQLYLSPTSSSQPLRPRQLQGFARIHLEQGEQKTVTIVLHPDQFGYFTHEGNRQWNIAPGKYTIKIGASSEDIKLHQDITLTGDKVAKTKRDVYLSRVK